MKERWEGLASDEGRLRVGDTGPRKVIQWISKSWTGHELQLPVFYRESLARLLALEKFRNQIEANVDSGITLYTDHKPGLYMNRVLVTKGNSVRGVCWRIKIFCPLWRIFIDKAEK